MAKPVLAVEEKSLEGTLKGFVGFVLKGTSPGLGFFLVLLAGLAEKVGPCLKVYPAKSGVPYPILKQTYFRAAQQGGIFFLVFRLLHQENGKTQEMVPVLVRTTLMRSLPWTWL